MLSSESSGLSYHVCRWNTLWPVPGDLRMLDQLNQPRIRVVRYKELMVASRVLGEREFKFVSCAARNELLNPANDATSYTEWFQRPRFMLCLCLLRFVLTKRVGGMCVLR